MDFVIIGAQKCATTFLQDALSLHPEVYMPKGEDAFLEVERPDATNFAERHIAKLRRRASSRVLGVKRPNYLVNSRVRDLLHLLSPQAFLLVVVREPVSRAMSAYYHYAARGLAPDINPNLFFQMMLSDSIDSYYPRAREILEWGRYAAYIEQWLEVWPHSSLLIVQQHRLLTEPREEMTRVLRFMGLSSQLEIPERSSNRGSYSPFRRSWLALGRSVAEGGDHKKTRALIGRVMRSTDARYLSRYGTGQQPKLVGSVRDQLEDYYASDQGDLARLLALQEAN